MSKAWSVELLDKDNKRSYIGEFVPAPEANEIHSIASQAADKIGENGSGMAIYAHHKSRHMEIKRMRV